MTAKRRNKDAKPTVVDGSGRTAEQGPPAKPLGQIAVDDGGRPLTDDGGRPVSAG